MGFGKVVWFLYDIDFYLKKNSFCKIIQHKQLASFFIKQKEFKFKLIGSMKFQ